MSKIVITADIHLGVHGRLNDILWSCRVIREYCQRAGVDTVLVLGDIFHDRRSLGIEVIAAACDFFEQAKKLGQKWVGFPGNHDMFLRHSWRINSLIPLRKYLAIVEDIKILLLDDRRFWIIPFISYEKSYMRVLRAVQKQHEEGDTLLTHIGVRGATLNTCFLLKDWSTVTFEHTPFKRIYTGHFHSKQQLGENVWYPGSPIPFKFDEGDVSHGFYVLDLETDTHKFIDIWKAGARFLPDETPPPQFHTITEDIVDQLDEEDARHNIFRVALDRDLTKDQKAQIREHILGLGAQKVRWMNLAQKEKRSTKKTITFRNDDELFTNWAKNDKKGTKRLDQKILARCHQEIAREADEKYALELADF